MTREKQIDRAFRRRLALQAGFQIKAKAAQALGQPLDIAHGVGRCSIGAAFDQPLTRHGELRRALLVKHVEHAAHLPQRIGKLLQCRTFAGVAGKRFHHFFNLLQRFIDLARGGGTQLGVVHLLHDVGAQPWWRAAGRFACGRGRQPVFHDGGLFFQIGWQAVILSEDILSHQQGRGHLQRHHLTIERIGVGQIGRCRVHAHQQLR